ncbi:DUF454 family protein, partial [Neisseria sicca]|uniref:DUF454 family protein n=1 Tax=Neisseria sicca TaxID=490 RepID=UPI0011BD1792
MIPYLLIFSPPVSLLLRIIRIFLPFLPTTPFLLLPPPCCATASPPFHPSLHQHPYFPPILQNSENNPALPPKPKIFPIT